MGSSDLAVLSSEDNMRCDCATFPDSDATMGAMMGAITSGVLSRVAAR